MKSLTEKDIKGILIEVWNSRLSVLHEKHVELKADIDVPNEGNVDVLSTGLKIIHKKSGFLYTVDALGSDSVVLKSPQGKRFKITKQELESDYELG
jgi:hypothetical protein